MHGPLARPFGFVGDEPVVRRIGDRALFLGNLHASDTDPGERFDHVVSLTTDPRAATTYHRPLTDGYDVEWSRFADAVDTARRLHRTDGSVLVHCKAGVSRSSAVLASTLAAAEGRRVRDALSEVQAARPIAMPHPDSTSRLSSTSPSKACCSRSA
jgi:atypical dual specificity phosphatase